MTARLWVREPGPLLVQFKNLFVKFCPSVEENKPFGKLLLVLLNIGLESLVFLLRLLNQKSFPPPSVSPGMN